MTGPSESTQLTPHEEDWSIISSCSDIEDDPSSPSLPENLALEGNNVQGDSVDHSILQVPELRTSMELSKSTVKDKNLSEITTTELEDEEEEEESDAAVINTAEINTADVESPFTPSAGSSETKSQTTDLSESVNVGPKINFYENLSRFNDSIKQRSNEFYSNYAKVKMEQLNNYLSEQEPIEVEDIEEETEPSHFDSSGISTPSLYSVVHSPPVALPYWKRGLVGGIEFVRNFLDRNSAYLYYYFIGITIGIISIGFGVNYLRPAPVVEQPLTTLGKLNEFWDSILYEEETLPAQIFSFSKKTQKVNKLKRFSIEVEDRIFDINEKFVKNMWDKQSFKEFSDNINEFYVATSEKLNPILEQVWEDTKSMEKVAVQNLKESTRIGLKNLDKYSRIGWNKAQVNGKNYWGLAKEYGIKGWFKADEYGNLGCKYVLRGAVEVSDRVSQVSESIYEFVAGCEIWDHQSEGDFLNEAKKTASIPKFFRFISERWPLISQLIEADQIQEFDNLYLDMNSILHTCTHSNDGSISRMSDDEMYAAIFNYIEHLFQIIKPKQTFYMAIDGVAPRAKMNQQRARRFRTAYEAEENLKKAIESGEEIPKEDPFDTNAITPGTEFMAALTNNLKYFIHKKITEDSSWANIKIILSGHEVPGEGEHKIMEYIRTMRSQSEYDPNLRHCIYGLDADLIMLSLVSHDPHFALLREEVTFGPQRSSKKNLHDQKFYLLHISLVREYLALEFQELEGQLTFEFDLERILDDFILIMYVIGNDFLPNLPDLFINKGAFPLLIAAFKQSLKQSDGYVNEDGKINLKRLNIWFEFLAEFEVENFERQEVDVEWFNKKLDDISLTGEKKRKRAGKLLILKDQKKLVGYIKPWLLEISNKPISETLELANEDKLPSLPLKKEDVETNLDFLREFALEVGILLVHSKSQDSYSARLDVDGLTPEETDEEYQERLTELRKSIKKYQSANLVDTEDILKETKDVYDSKFIDWKNSYYQSKLHFTYDEQDKLIELTEHYIEGLQWVLYYYYRGVPSWNWFYKYHYAPSISDISIGLKSLIEKNKDLEFDQSKPFKPFEQLMAVLPARSRKLMPLEYRTLMTDEKSPIISFYPHEVAIDMNGKTASWEAVVLLDFVDENKLLAALKPIESKLTPEETKRNSYGHNIIFIHNPQIDSVYPSPLPAFFHAIEHDKCYEEEFKLPKVDQFKIGLLEGAKTGTDLLAGFPTLHSIPFQAELALNEVKVFNFPSRSESMVLTLENPWNDLSVHQFAQQFVGKLTYSRWPFLRECKVVKVMDESNKYELIKTHHGAKKLATEELAHDERRTFNSEISYQRMVWDKTKGVKLGDIEGLAFVQPVTGLIRNAKGAYVKTFSRDLEIIPLQLIVKEVTNIDPRYVSRPPIPIDQEFPIDSRVIFLGDMGYGSPATVVGYTENELNIKIFKIPAAAEPLIGKKRLAKEQREIKYYPSFEVSKTLRISPLLLSRITSQFMVQDEKSKINIGLELKFESKREKVLGYTRKSNNGKFWEFSPLAVNLLNTYKMKFPKLFNNLSKLNMKDMPKVSDISNPEEIKEVRSWLKEVKTDLIPVSLESESLTKFSFSAIEQSMELYLQENNPTIDRAIRGVPRDAILNASESYQLLSDQRFELGDRIVYVQDFGKVPVMSKGTVGSILTVGSKTSLGVIFDEPLLGGDTMNGKLRTKRGLIIDSSLVLNLTDRQYVYHSRASKVRKPLTSDERVARNKAAEHWRLEQDQKKVEEEKQRQEVLKQESQKQTRDLLSLLNMSEDEPEHADKEEEQAVTNPNAIKQIYGQIYSSVMNQGAPAPPPAMPMGYGGYIPAVPGIPIPPQFLQQEQSQPVNEHPGHTEHTGEAPRRGRGGYRGRGRGVSHVRGGGHFRGRGRGKPRGKSESSQSEKSHSEK
ncbi:5'-3' exoribonuclease 1 [Spathaspora sp. JA1]|nr:5'-3' exoribonuclease 1 [Spathaspora sp. JA1]